MKSRFKLLAATLSVGVSVVTFAASTDAGLLGNTVEGAIGAAKGAAGGALGGNGGVLGGSSSSGSTASGGTTASAGVGAAVGNSRRNGAAAAQMLKDMSPAEKRRIVKKCSHVLASPAAFDKELVALCRIIALDIQPVPRTAKSAKRKTSAAKPRQLARRTIASMVPPPPQELFRTTRKAEKQNVSNCLGDDELSPAEVLQLEKDIPGCVLRRD